MCSLSGTTTNHLVWRIVYHLVRQKIPQIPTTLSSPVWWDQVHQEEEELEEEATVEEEVPAILVLPLRQTVSVSGQLGLTTSRRFTLTN